MEDNEREPHGVISIRKCDNRQPKEPPLIDPKRQAFIMPSDVAESDKRHGSTTE